MGRRSGLIACAIGAGLADLAWLAMAAPSERFDRPPLDSRYHLSADEPYEVTVGRLIECRARQVWIEDGPKHYPPRWVMEMSRHNGLVAACFNRRSIGGGNDWWPAPAAPASATD